MRSGSDPMLPSAEHAAPSDVTTEVKDAGCHAFPSPPIAEKMLIQLYTRPVISTYSAFTTSLIIDGFLFLLNCFNFEILVKIHVVSALPCLSLNLISITNVCLFYVFSI